MAQASVTTTKETEKISTKTPRDVVGLQAARTNVWPTAVQLHTKLYGSEEELEKTATLILQTGLSV